MINDSMDDTFQSIVEGNSKGGKKGKKVQYRGVEYNTIKELADAVGKSEPTIQSWIKKGKVVIINQ